jgi:hypothetical protein
VPPLACPSRAEKPSQAAANRKNWIVAGRMLSQSREAIATIVATSVAASHDPQRRRVASSTSVKMAALINHVAMTTASGPSLLYTSQKKTWLSQFWLNQVWP